MDKRYNTRHAEHVTEAIKEFNGEHFTAEELCNKCREKGENIGLSTVYRHLERLVGENKVRKFISSAGESACFQEQNKKCEHFHLKCTVCGKLEHLSCKTLEEISAHVLYEHGFSIDPEKTVFYGNCRECGAK